MKVALIAAAIAGLALAVPSAPARALELAPPAATQLYTCAQGHLSRVALRDTPAPCCEGMLGCPQLLANSGLIRPKRNNRT